MNEPNVDPKQPDAGHGLAAVRRQVEQLWRVMFRDATLELTDTTDFFALGGNSLLALELVESLYEEFGIELGILALVEHSTVSRLTALIKEHLDREDEEGTL